MKPSARGKLLRRLGDLVEKHAERLAKVEVRDNGKLITEMLAQLRYQPEGGGTMPGLRTRSK